MPRTKRPVKNQEKISEDDDASKKLNKLVKDIKSRIDSCAQMEIRNVEIGFKILMESIPNDYLTKTIGQLNSECQLKEINTNTRSASHDDGYLTENSSQSSGDRRQKSRLVPPSSSRSTTTTRRSRSADASTRKYPPSVASNKTQRRRSRSVYRTPAYNKHAPVNYPVITPKVAPHTPLTVLRQPRQGEMVVSMSGSPVVVPTCYSMQPGEKANCNILLQDGTMLSLQPKPLRQSQAYIPFSLMDSHVLDQLKTIKDNIGKMVKLSEKVIK